MAMKPQPDKGPRQHLLLRKAFPRAHLSPNSKETALLCTHISDVYRWASRANTPGLQNAIERQIHAIAKALDQGREVSLDLPATTPSNDPLTLAQQCCKAIAEIYATVARDPKVTVGLERHLKTLDAVFDRARELWKSDSAAATYLERPSPQFDGKTPLDVATESSSGAQRVVTAIKTACTNLTEIEDNARQVISSRPSPTAKTVYDAALAFLGDRAQADTFLGLPHPLLAGRTPRDLAAESPEGAARVERLIRQAQAGTAI